MIDDENCTAYDIGGNLGGPCTCITCIETRDSAERYGIPVKAAPSVQTGRTSYDGVKSLPPRTCDVYIPENDPYKKPSYIDQVIDERNALKSQLDEMRVERDRYEAEWLKHVDQGAELANTVFNHEQYILKLQRDVMEVAKERDQLKRQEEMWELLCDMYLGDADKSDKDKQALEKENEALRTSNQSFEAANKFITQSLEFARADNEKLKQEMAGTCSRLYEETSRVLDEAGIAPSCAVYSRVGALVKGRDILRAQVDHHLSTITALEVELDALKDENAKLLVRSWCNEDPIGGKPTGLAERFATLEQERDSARTELALCRNATEYLHKEVDGLMALVKRTAEERDALQTEVYRIRSELAHVCGQIEGMTEGAERLKRDLKATEAHVDRMSPVYDAAVEYWEADGRGITHTQLVAAVAHAEGDE